LSVKITERSLYPFIIALFKELSANYNVSVSGVLEVSIPGRSYPDVLLGIDGYRVLIQVKVGAPEKLREDIAKTYPPARSLGADLICISFPEEVRQIRPEEVEKVYPNLTVARGLVLTVWQGQEVEKITLSSLIESIVKAYAEYKRTSTPVVDYLTVAKVARETVEDLATILREYIGVERYMDTISAIVGRFDYYKAMLEDFLSEEEMKIYMADITAYLLTLQLLFLHVVSRKIYNIDLIPKIENPLDPPKNLLERLINVVEGSDIVKQYHKVIGALPLILKALWEIAQQDPRVTSSISRYIYTFYPLRPENVREELFGRIYQLGIPPETRKNLGAFFTRPEAAKLLASLAVERWDEKVLDPACGSGTLLAESYHAKVKKAREQGVVNLEKSFIEDHIVGIDIMQFARELASINLALQNLSIKVNPRIFAGDGLEKMMFAEIVDDPPALLSIYSFLEALRKEYESLSLPREGFDLVIMNPPFTRRERIPEKERKRLDTLLGNIVRGKVGYSLYFFAAVDNVIKPGGRLAAVTPEEFFAGGAAESVRRFLFRGEVYDEKSKKCLKKEDRVYMPKYIVKSAVDIAFSEGALYRDYLAVFDKQRIVNDGNTMVSVILKKKLAELNVEKVVEQILRFSNSSEEKMSTDDFNARKIHGISFLVSKHIGNLKPLVGLNCIRAQELIMELLEDLSQNPTLRECEDRGIMTLRDYTCQHTTSGSGIEEYIRRLFISRYGGRGKISFTYKGESEDNLHLRVLKAQMDFSMSKKNCVYSLRSPAKVIHMDVTGEEEYAVANAEGIPDDALKLAGLIDVLKVNAAANDVREAYNDLAGNILLVRRAQVTSPNIYWLAFFSERRIIGPSAPMICLQVDKLGMKNSKLLTLYLNSSIALLQLLGFAVETRGAWIAFQGDQVWSNIHLPNFDEMPRMVEDEALNMFNKVGKLNTSPLYRRIRDRNDVQRSIDAMALKMLGLEDTWLDKLDDVYDAILCELDVLQRILEESSKEKRVKRRSEEEEEDYGRQAVLDTFFKLV